MQDKIGNWKKEWEKTENGILAVRYYNPYASKQTNLQLSKYRPADDMDKALNTNYEWHDKWYVNIWNPEKTYLFKTEAEAKKFAISYMKKTSKGETSAYQKALSLKEHYKKHNINIR